MFARLFALLPLALLASASPLEARDGTCNSGSVNCCNSVQSYQQALPYILEKGISLVDIEADVGALVGITCSPISVIGAGGNSCNQQTVCCTNNNFNGVIAAGCTPINVNL